MELVRIYRWQRVASGADKLGKFLNSLRNNTNGIWDEAAMRQDEESEEFILAVQQAREAIAR